MTAGRPSLVVCPHPLLAAAGREIHYAEFRPGESIAEYLDRMGVRLGAQPWLLAVDGHPVPREWWGRVRPKPGTLITMRALVQKGGGGGGKNPMQTVLSIALMVAAPGIGNAIAGAMGMSGTAFTVFGEVIKWGQVFAGVVSVAGSLVISALTQPPRPQLSEVNGTYSAEQVSPTYALSGGSNRARPFEPLPLLLGHHRIFPDLGAKDFTEFEGDDQYLYQIFNFGIGTVDDLQLTNFCIGSTPVENYSDVEIYEAGPDGKLPQMPGNVDTTAGGTLTSAAGWITRTSGAGSTALAVDIQGQLYRAGGAGLESLSCDIEAQYRLVGTTDWMPWFAETLSSASRNPIRRTWRKSVIEGQYEIRVRRVTADETDARNVSEFAWNALKSYQPDAADYTGQRRVGVRIKASGQLQGRIEQFNAIGQRLVPVWHADTGTWVTEATSNPAWLTLWFARGGSINGRPSFGVGLADRRIDIEGLKAWGAFCQAKSLTFNAVFDSSRSRSDFLNTIARCGRGSPSWATGKLGVVWDAPDQPVVAVFGMANIVSGSFRIQYATEKLADEVVVNFVNPDNDWQQDQVRAKVPGFPSDYVPQRPVTLEFFGCTDKDMAGREANLIAASQRCHRRRVVWDADFEGLVAQRGDVIALSHDLTQWGSSGRLVGATAYSLHLDRPVSYSTGSPYVMVRHPDGSFHVRAVQPFSGETDTLVLTASLSFSDEGGSTYHCGSDPLSPVFDYTYVFEPLPTPGKRIKIVGVPSAKNSGARVQYVATDDDPEYYAAESSPYVWVPRASGGALATISNLAITEELVPTGTGYAVRLHLTWDSSGAFDHAIILTGDRPDRLRVSGTTIISRGEVQVPDTGTIVVRVVLVDGAGRTDPTNGAAQIEYVIQGKALPPSDIPWATIEGTAISFGTVPDRDLSGYIWRWLPGVNRDWGIALPLHKGLVTESPWTMPNPPAGLVTIMGKAVDNSANESSSAVSIIFQLGDAPVQNVVQTIDFAALSWPGVIEGGVLDAGTGHLVASSAGGAFYLANESASMFPEDGSQPMFPASTYSAMVWTSGWTALPALPTDTRLRLAAALSGCAARVEYRIDSTAPAYPSDGTGPMFPEDGSGSMYAAPSPWAPFPAAGIPVPGASIQLRAFVEGGATEGRFESIALVADAPDIVETLNEIVISATGTRLPVTKSFTFIKAITFGLRSDGGPAVNVKILDKNPTLGPLVCGITSAGMAAGALIDATIYGG